MKPRTTLKKLKNKFYCINLPCNSSFSCPVCNSEFRKFIPYSRNKKQNLRCPVCKSLNRHRLLWLFFKANQDLFNCGMKILHFAPEPCLESKFVEMKDITYITADIDPFAAKVSTDITDICFKDSYFDAVICNHVLEHIPDDKKAMQEIYRVLKSGGWAVLMVPLDIQRESTYENSSVVTTLDRLKHFEQEDHVRIYGNDYTDRLKNVGFTVYPVDFADKFSESQTNKFGISKEYIYFCKK